MAKLAITAALFAVFLVIANTAACRTTITTIDIDEDNSRQSQQRCREQIQRQDLNRCEEYLMRSSRGYLALRGVPNTGNLQECCEQLRQMDQQCRCPGIRQMMREHQQEMQGQEMREMMQTARNLPSMCGMRPQRCEMESEWL